MVFQCIHDYIWGDIQELDLFLPIGLGRSRLVCSCPKMKEESEDKNSRPWKGIGEKENLKVEDCRRRERTGNSEVCKSWSTDCNVSLSKDIPWLCWSRNAVIRFHQPSMKQDSSENQFLNLAQGGGTTTFELVHHNPRFNHLELPELVKLFVVNPLA